MRTLNLTKTIKEIEWLKLRDDPCLRPAWNHALIIAIQIIRDNIKNDKTIDK